MYLEIITPDENVFEGEVESAVFPGSDGAFQILNDHAPLVSSIGSGDVKIVKIQDKKTEEIANIAIGAKSGRPRHPEWW